MDFDHDNVRQVVEQDRLSNLPDELIHNIMSCIDMKFAVQTCLLSSRWKFFWTSMPCLIFSTNEFGTLPKFDEFVTHVQSHRNHQIELSSVKLFFKGSLNQLFVEKIAKYAFSHNVQQLTISINPHNNLTYYPSCLFSSQSLKHFTFSNSPFCHTPCLTPKTHWDFPALTTLHLSDITLCDNHFEKSIDLFSKCVNLKTLILKSFYIVDVEVFDIITPRLSTLVLIHGRSFIPINLIAPKLENLTIIDCPYEYFNAPPGLSSLCYSGYCPMKLSEDGFHNLNKASICFSVFGLYRGYSKENALTSIKMLQQLHSVRYLTLNAHLIECLSSFPDIVSHHPSPFSKLIRLTIDPSKWKNAYKVKMSTEVRNFFLKNSPNAIIKLPEGC